ncbi:MAG: hypothetical protein GYA62_03820 [Bacteroidales bacterium]|jgi:hypothetical protein|nr:hypothetical protein [Bacteroidales bacterium]
MKDEQFEKYWQEQFEHFESDPNEMVWDKMSQELFVRQSKSVFKNFIVQPGANVWRKIAIVLWWNRFTKFSPYTFNAYYLLVAILSTFTLGTIFELNHPRYDKKISSNSVVNNYLNNPRTASVWLENESPTYQTITQSNNNHTTTTYPKKQKKQTNSLLISNIDERNSLFEETGITSIEPSSIPNRIDRISVKETFHSVNDTALRFLKHRSISLYIAPTLFNSTLSFIAKEGNSLNSNYNPVKSTIFNNFAISFFYEWQHFNFKLQTGITYQSLSKSYTYNNASFSNDTLYHLNIIDNSYYNYSYIQVLNLDSLLLTGDTIWMTYVDSTLVINYDTLQTTDIQTIRKNNNAKQKYGISAIEIPFLAGYSYSFGKFDLTLKAGSSISYILLTKGYLPSSSNDYGTEPFKQEKINNIYINIMAGAEANYFITDRISLSFMPLYRHNVTRLIKNELPLRLNLQTWSFNFGIKYQIR